VYGIDLKDGDDVLYCLPEEADFDIVFHLSAYPRVNYSVTHPSYTMQQNVLVTSKLLEWSKNHKVKKFIFSSSAAVSGSGGTPESPYGLHKLISEMECKLYRELYGLNCVCLRYFNVYSEDQPYSGAYTTAISAWMEMIRQNKPLRVDGDGEQTRDFIHVEDVVSANIVAMHAEMEDDYYNVGCGKSYSLNYIKEYISMNHLPRSLVKWETGPVREGDIRDSIADNRSLVKCGWQPTVQFEDGLSRCFHKRNTSIIGV
jgi:UDP-glucose 4-epimerase